MLHRYTDKEKEFIKNICTGRTTYEIMELFNKQFHSDITRSQIKSYMTNHGLKGGIDRSELMKKFVKKLFTDEQIEFIKDNAKGLPNEELTKRFNNHFKTNIATSQIKALKAREHINSGLDGHFPKGNIPFNKGIKGVCAKGCEKTWFKKGIEPINHRPLGSERVDVDGYTLVKIAEPNEWRLKHQVVWEKENGPIPKGYAVIFGDRDRSNFDINNLILVSRQQLLILNRNKLIQNDADLTRTGVIIADVYKKISERKSKKAVSK